MTFDLLVQRIAVEHPSVTLWNLTYDISRIPSETTKINAITDMVSVFVVVVVFF